MFLRVSKSSSVEAVKPVANDAGFAAGETAKKPTKKIEQAAVAGNGKASAYTESQDEPSALVGVQVFPAAGSLAFPALAQPVALAVHLETRRPRPGSMARQSRPRSTA